ncbi:hypothetical protein [Streptomyces erythrochromogenes]|uniref:hypothetical protein n=1 Tax=Streptomyces erythrochromogenes TaxID=285574 RepID=UPI0037D5CBAE
MFFKNERLYPGDDYNTFGSSIGNAPPTWQDIAVAFCTDVSVKPCTWVAATVTRTLRTGSCTRAECRTSTFYVNGEMNFFDIPGLSSRNETPTANAMSPPAEAAKIRGTREFRPLS